MPACALTIAMRHRMGQRVGGCFFGLPPRSYDMMLHLQGWRR